MSLSCLGYADDVLLFSRSKASLEAMIEDCCVKWFWTKLTGAVRSRWTVRHWLCETRKEAGVYRSVIEAWCAQWRSGEAPFSKGVLGLLQVETSPVQSKPVVERASESVWSKHSLEFHVVEWLLDFVKAARTGVGILVCSSLGA